MPSKCLSFHLGEPVSSATALEDAARAHGGSASGVADQYGYQDTQTSLGGSFTLPLPGRRDPLQKTSKALGREFSAMAKPIKPRKLRALWRLFCIAVLGLV